MKVGKRGLLVVLVFTILFISMVSAQEIRFLAKQNTITEITETCQNNGFPCDATVLCNITIQDPDQKVIVLNKKMDRNETVYNITLEVNQSAKVGIYENNVCCANASDGACGTFFYKVTTSGNDINTSQSIIYIIVLIISVMILCLSVWGAIIIPKGNKKNAHGFITDISYLKHVKIFLWILSYLELMWIANLLVGITRNFLFLGLSFNFFRLVYLFLTVGLIALIPIMAMVLINNIIEDKKIRKWMERMAVTE